MKKQFFLIELYIVSRADEAGSGGQGSVLRGR